MKPEFLLSNKNSSNCNINKYYYDSSSPNSKTNRKSRKVSISSIEDQISELDSCIEELYKIYSERKKIRLNKEKISQNMINRINYLTSEERKIRNMLEKQINKNKRNSNDKWKTSNNTLKNSPKIKNKRTKSVENSPSNSINNKIKYLSGITKEKLLYKYNKETINNSTTKNKDSHKSFIFDSNVLNNKTRSNNNSIYNINTQKNQNKQNITNNIYIIINKNDEKMKNNSTTQKYTNNNIKNTKEKRNINNLKSKINKNSNTYVFQKGKDIFDSPSFFDEKDCVKIIKEQKSQVKYLEKKLELKKDIMNKKNYKEKNKEQKKTFFVFNIYNNSIKKNINENTNNIKKTKVTANVDVASPMTPLNKNSNLNKTKQKIRINNAYKKLIEHKKELMGLKLNNKENTLLSNKLKEDLTPKVYLTFENEKHIDDYDKDNNEDDIYNINVNNNNKATEVLKEPIKTKNNYVLNTSVKDHYIKIKRKIKTPSNKLKIKTMNKIKKTKFVNSQININHNMMKKLFKQNKKNENKNNNKIIYDINYFRKDNIKNNNSVVKNEINTIRRINLKIENLKNKTFLDRKKNSNDIEGITVKRLKNIKNKHKNKSISEKCSKKNINIYKNTNIL